MTFIEEERRNCEFLGLHMLTWTVFSFQLAFTLVTDIHRPGVARANIAIGDGHSSHPSVNPTIATGLHVSTDSGRYNFHGLARIFVAQIWTSNARPHDLPWQCCMLVHHPWNCLAVEGLSKSSVGESSAWIDANYRQDPIDEPDKDNSHICPYMMAPSNHPRLPVMSYYDSYDYDCVFFLHYVMS